MWGAVCSGRGAGGESAIDVYSSASLPEVAAAAILGGLWAARPNCSWRLTFLPGWSPGIWADARPVPMIGRCVGEGSLRGWEKTGAGLAGSPAHAPSNILLRTLILNTRMAFGLKHIVSMYQNLLGLKASS